ncbi:hypothetical protein [Serratia sp. D1N4]
MSKRFEELSQPVAYTLRFKKDDGTPESRINVNTTFSNKEAAQKYSPGGRYKSQPHGKIEWVRDAALDPDVIELYSQEYVAALLEALNEQRAEMDKANMLIDELKEERNLLQRLAGERQISLEAAERKIEVMKVESSGAAHRIKLILDTKDYWVDRAMQAEQRLQQPIDLADAIDSVVNDVLAVDTIASTLAIKAIFHRHTGIMRLAAATKVEGE